MKYLSKALLAGVYGDAIAAMYSATAIREVHRGQALALADELLDPLSRGVLPLDKKSVMACLADAVARFNDIATNDRSYPKVGIVGEIYAKYNSFANHNAAQWLMDQGMEVVLPKFLTYFLGWFVSTDVRVKGHLQHRSPSWLLANVLEWPVQGVLDRAEAIMRNFKHYYPSHSIREVAGAAEEVVSLTHAYGEGWVIAGEIGTLVEAACRMCSACSPLAALPTRLWQGE